MRILVWLVRAAIFFTLFAFALNNQHDAAVRWFFGQEWRAPMVFIVLGAFALGCAFGVFSMVPAWWRHRSAARHRGRPAVAGDSLMSVQPPAPPAEPLPAHPPRDGL
jgi:putative membrane protein